MAYIAKILSLIIGWVLDFCLGDPERLPHPIVLFGKTIAFGERIMNRGRHRMLKGGVMALALIGSVYTLAYFLIHELSFISIWLEIGIESILIFFCLAGTTLIKESKQVFSALEHSLEEGRAQVSRIVGRDTSSLSEQEIKQATLETLSENLSDGVVAPLFWLAILGVPGILTYKMVNTLDSMIGYRTLRYLLFGSIAARIDDIANYLPARLTALMMLLVSGKFRQIKFVMHYGKAHLSPNSGYPESALAAILDCRFGGSHLYFGEWVDKPMIGFNPRELTIMDLKKAIIINRSVELLTIIALIVFYLTLAVL
ncbi:cobalamin biosynthesis protein CobD [Prevotella sp. DNF00663]|uniref:adenosylcobinamide-phosphate synthase CbiB n=1 Tax=unclassified Prevotella TaxID=2638335 RepID=UPI000512FD8B|nr:MULTISPECIES: adenosylcobinamide-phosphate synthase CbiB [unclassified Prevotella]KGI59666.1 cobalamin biosynthesis protein CobD [Prevotella sp. S7 MS 2]KXB83169.1 cobalamin biosynthesis protein CobD [Prevotella sp. DNF00663]